MSIYEKVIAFQSSFRNEYTDRLLGEQGMVVVRHSIDDYLFSIAT